MKHIGWEKKRSKKMLTSVLESRSTQEIDGSSKGFRPQFFSFYYEKRSPIRDRLNSPV